MKLEINGILVNYIEEGTHTGREAIILLHGWGSNIQVFGEIIKTLSPHYKLYAMDMPGCGDTGEPEQAWGVEDYVNFVIAFIKHFGLEKVSLLGHSNGGRVIIQMNSTKNLPFEIQKIVLVDSAGIKPEKTTKQKLDLKLYKGAKAVLSLPPIKAVFPEALKKMQDKRGSADYKNATPIMRATLVKLVNVDLRHLLSAIHCPTLLLWGDMDTATPLADAKIMEELISDAGLVVIKGAGHYSFLEHPYFAISVLKSFFNVE